MKKRCPFFVLILLAITLSFQSCLIRNPKPEDCSVKQITVSKIAEGSSYDIVFHNDNNDSYYINRGLERGLNLDSLNAKVLNKTVTLHLANVFYGASGHIAQLAIDDEIIFTEF